MNSKKSLPILLIVILAVLLGFLQQRGQTPGQNRGADQPVSTTAAASKINIATPAPAGTPEALQEAALDERGSYTSREDVALYLHTYGRLPDNFITKTQARDLGWPGGDLRPYAPGKAIGGDRFGNFEGLLPNKKGRTYYECDIDTMGKSSRGAKRLVYSNDGLIYYTDDHYESFIRLYGEE